MHIWCVYDLNDISHMNVYVSTEDAPALNWGICVIIQPVYYICISNYSRGHLVVQRTNPLQLWVPALDPSLEHAARSHVPTWYDGRACDGHWSLPSAKVKAFWIVITSIVKQLLRQGSLHILKIKYFYYSLMNLSVKRYWWLVSDEWWLCIGYCKF